MMITADPSAGNDGLFISWMRSNRRSQSFADALGLRVVFMPWAGSQGTFIRTIVGWCRSSARTAALLARAPRGSVAVVMAPPVWALLIGLLFARRLHLAADIHSGAVNSRRWQWSAPITFWCARRFDAIVTTNLMLFDGHSTGATPVIVLTNPSLYQAGSEVLPLSDPSENAIPTVVFPASGEDDEPLDEVAAAAALLQGEVRIVATGRLPAELAASALELSGFLPDAEFEALMVSASAVLALTTREATNQRSAAEAIERGLPLVCSDTQMLRATYGRAAVMVPNTGDGIAAGVHEALQRRRELHDSAIDLRAELIAEANRAIEQLGAALS